jgi:hypothetical protein
MSISIGSNPASVAALRVYQQVKQHGEPTPSRAELQAKLDAEQGLSSNNANLETDQANLSNPAQVNTQATPLSNEEQIQQQRELERAWGLMSAVLGTQLDEYA